MKGCKNYEDTLIEVHRSHQRQGLPISYFLVDSWWYGEREHGGVWMWEDTPTLVSDTFPGNATHPGMKRLSAELGGLSLRPDDTGRALHQKFKLNCRKVADFFERKIELPRIERNL